VINVMMAYALAAFAAQLVAGFLSDLVGRRPMIIGASLCAIASIWLWSALPDGQVGLWLGSLSFACALMPAGVLLVYTTELFPTALRGTGQSMTIGIARLIAVAAPALGGEIVGRLGYATEFRVASAFLVITILATWFGPETAGRDLVDAEAEPSGQTATTGRLADAR
jgi:putative MFS transporter